MQVIPEPGGRIAGHWATGHGLIVHASEGNPKASQCKWKENSTMTKFCDILHSLFSCLIYDIVIIICWN